MRSLQLFIFPFHYQGLRALSANTGFANIGVPLVLCVPKHGSFFMDIRTTIVPENNL
uniref:Uncharacterized protein n=1 Tax=Solanum lycopersicum TaxID=4081 RepID=A0A3Q7GTQ0_SOLLC